MSRCNLLLFVQTLNLKRGLNEVKDKRPLNVWNSKLNSLLTGGLRVFLLRKTPENAELAIAGPY